jgi:hypothetical protein
MIPIEIPNGIREAMGRMKGESKVPPIPSISYPKNINSNPETSKTTKPIRK